MTGQIWVRAPQNAARVFSAGYEGHVRRSGIGKFDDAVLNASKAVNEIVQKRSNIRGDNNRLMPKAFSFIFFFKQKPAYEMIW